MHGTDQDSGFVQTFIGLLTGHSQELRLEVGMLFSGPCHFLEETVVEWLK